MADCPLGNETSLSCHPNSVVDSCVSQPNRTNYSQGVWIYSSEPVLGKLCAPLNASQFPVFENYTDKVNDVGERLSDLQNTWMIITSSAFVALFIGYNITCLDLSHLLIIIK